MGFKKWEDVRRRSTPKEEAEDKAWVDAQLLEMNMAELREHAGLTQSQLAAAVEMTQSQLSRLENRSDHLVSTIRTVVEAVGGELEVVATIKGKQIRLVGV